MTLPVAEVVRRICREFGLVAETLEAQLPLRSGIEPPGIDTVEAV